MEAFPYFLSLVIVVRNQAELLEQYARDIGQIISVRVRDYEIIFVDNASVDDSVGVLKGLTGEEGLPNLQVYALTKEVDEDIAACCVGMENALGDFVVVFNPVVDDIGFLPEMLAHAQAGIDMVFAHNVLHRPGGAIYRTAYAAFNMLYRWFNGIDLSRETSRYRVLSRRVVNFMLQHRSPSLAFRHLPATGGFTRVMLSYRAPGKPQPAKSLSDSIDRGVRLLISTTRAPMRLVAFLSLFGAVANLIYSVYVVAIALFKADVAPGWVSLSLQQSGMFFLISLVLLVLGEYIVNMTSLSNEGPAYHVAQEFTSARMTRREKLNVEEVVTQTLRS